MLTKVSIQPSEFVRCALEQTLSQRRTPARRLLRSAVRHQSQRGSHAWRRTWLSSKLQSPRALRSYGLGEKAFARSTCVQRKHAWSSFHYSCAPHSCDLRAYGQCSFGQRSCVHRSCVQRSCEPGLFCLSTCALVLFDRLSDLLFFHPSSHHVMIFWLQP